MARMIELRQKTYMTTTVPARQHSDSQKVPDLALSTAKLKIEAKWARGDAGV